jgi:hypothetical protein
MLPFSFIRRQFMTVAGGDTGHSRPRLVSPHNCSEEGCFTSQRAQGDEILVETIINYFQRALGTQYRLLPLQYFVPTARSGLRRMLPIFCTYGTYPHLF